MHKIVSKVTESEKVTPFKLTKKEKEMLEPNYKVPKKRRPRSTSSVTFADNSTPEDRARQRSMSMTLSSKLKMRISEDFDDMWTEIESQDYHQHPFGVNQDVDEYDDDDDDDDVYDERRLDPTYEMVSLKRANEKKQNLASLKKNSKEMFHLLYYLNVKQEEKSRLEKVLRQEEEELQKAEAELRLAQQAFDQFLQENDSKSIQAQKRAEAETTIRLEKITDIKDLDNRILSLKREIYKLKDQLGELNTFKTFLYSLSPEAWRTVCEQKIKDGIENRTEEEKLEDEQKRVEKEECFKVASRDLGISMAYFGSMDCDNNISLYFDSPQQLLAIFSDLEDENLRLIEQCQEAEDKLEEVKVRASETRSRLNNQAGKFEAEIDRLQKQLNAESNSLKQLEVTMAMHPKFASLSGKKILAEKRTKIEEDDIIEELDAKVTRIHDHCVGQSRSKISTLEKLKRIELRMELLTKELELLPEEKVKIAQKTCERERRTREEEARQAEHKRLHALRNQKALDRALAPSFIKPELRQFQPPPDILIRRMRRLRRLRQRLKDAQEEEQKLMRDEQDIDVDNRSTTSR